MKQSPSTKHCKKCKERWFKMLGSKRKNEKLLEQNGCAGLRLVDTDTGEFVDLPYGTSIRLPELKIDEDNPKRCIHNNEGAAFMKVYEKCDNLILDSCSIGEYAFLSKLRRFISFNENVIRCGGNHEGHVLTPKEIAEELHMNVNQVRDYIRFFKNADILADYKLPSKDNPKIATKCIVVNPWVYSKGQYMLTDVCKMFENSFWHYLAYANRKEIENIEVLNPINACKTSKISG